MSPIAIIAITIFTLIVLAAIILLTVMRIRPYLYKADGTDFSSAESTVEFVVPKIGTPYLIKRKSDGSISDERFKILTCTDTHIKTAESELTFTLLERFLDMEKPDLVILTGDNVVGRSDTVMQEKLKRFFETRKQYWGFVLGNHDSEYKIKTDIEEAQKHGALSDEQIIEIGAAGRKWMFDSLSGGTCCIVNDEGGRDVHGSGNCVVNIRNSKGISQSLFFFDSGDYVRGVKRKAIGSEKRCYDYIRENQLDWYKRRLAELTEENGGILPKSIAFFHIPLPEYQEAFSACRLGKRYAKRIYGTNYEKPCSSDINIGAFDVFRDSNSTHIIVCGHDHKNDSCIDYKGVKLMYSQGLQYDGAYNRRKKSPFLKLLNNISDKFCCFIEGVSLFMVNEDGSVDIAAKYAQKEGMYYGLEKYYGRAFLTGTIKYGGAAHGKQ